MKKSKPPVWLKPTIIGAAVVMVLAAYGTAGTWASGAAFLAFNKNDPRRAKPLSLVRYWSEYGEDEKMRKKLVGSMALGYGVPAAATAALYISMQTRRSAHGNARWATPAEVMRSGLMDGTGLIVGRYKGEYLTLPQDMHIMAVAPTGSGKTKALVIPNMLNWDHSAIMQDNKREVEKATSGFRAAHGHNVFRFAPYDEEGRTHGFNPLVYIRDDPVLRISDLMEMAQTIYPHDNSSVNGGGNFFAGSSRDLFLFMGLYVLESPQEEMPHTIGQMLRVVGGDGRPIREYFADLVIKREAIGQPLSYDCVAACTRLLSAADDTLGDVVRTFLNDLQVFADPLVDSATSRSDFDLRRMRHERMTVYVQIPFKKTTVSRVLTNLLFSLAINCQLDEDFDPGKHKHEVLWCADELTSLGRLPIIAYGSGFVRSYGIRLFILFQSMGQLEAEYTEHVARAIAANHRCRVLFAPAEQRDAKEQSEMLGTYDLKVRNTNRSSSTTGNSTGSSEHAEKRDLMMAQELRRMPFEHQIVDIVGQLPVYCHKAFFNEDPELLARSLYKPADIPVHDPRLYRARIRQHVRLARPEEKLGEDLGTQRIAADLSDLPPLQADCSDEEAQSFVSALFARLDSAPSGNAAAGGEANSIAPEPEPALDEAEEPAPPPAAEMKPRRKPKGEGGKGGSKRKKPAVEVAAVTEPAGLFPELDSPDAHLNLDDDAPVHMTPAPRPDDLNLSA